MTAHIKAVSKRLSHLEKGSAITQEGQETATFPPIREQCLGQLRLLYWGIDPTNFEKRCIMKGNYRHFVGGILMALLFALPGCGSTSSSVDNGTSTSEPVSIRTDHSTYLPTDSIHASVVNNLQASIFAFDTRASCSILDLQMQVNGVWQDTNIARCPLGRPAMRVEIPAGQTYSATIQAGSLGISQASFLAGSYRLVLSYSTSATSLPQQSTTTIYSATFSVTNSSH